MTVIAIAIIGTLVFNFVPVPPAVAFAIGVIITGLAIHFMPDSQPSSQDSIDSSQSSKTIYVGNLPYRANENDVKNLFAEHGEVFAVRLMKDKRTGKRRGFGFVVMNSQDADTAIAFTLTHVDYRELVQPRPKSLGHTQLSDDMND